MKEEKQEKTENLQEINQENKKEHKEKEIYKENDNLDVNENKRIRTHPMWPNTFDKKSILAFAFLQNR